MKIAFTGVEQRGDHWYAQREITRDDGTIDAGSHVFPLDTLEWRAAEYGIDPADVDTLLDVVLAEPYLTPEDWAAGYLPHDAPDAATARQDHIARCARAKLRHRISTRPGPAGGSAAKAGENASVPGHPLDPIRRQPGIDAAVVAVKADYVQRVRVQLAEEAARRAREPREDRVTRIRRELGMRDQHEEVPRR
ncbi:hypothetical protein AB0425_17585 [Actinosynnema sp. NPDC051121]